MSKFVFNCSMTQMIQIFTDLQDYPNDTQDFLCEKIDDYNYILKSRPTDESIGNQSVTYFNSKRYFSIQVVLSSLSFAEQQIKCTGNTKRLKFLIHVTAICVGLYYLIIDAEGINWLRLIFIWWISYVIFVYYTNTMREEIVLAVRKSIIRKTFVRGNRRR